MPRLYALSKSGVHRAACFALYRALLRQKHELQLNEHQQHLFRKPIQALFKRNSKLQSPPQISTALQLGYETLEGLYDGARQKNTLVRILELAVPRRSNAQPDDASSSRTKTARANKDPKVPLAPYPGASRTLDRPFKDLSGPRNVPILVNANRVPFLRLKKPQSPFVSRIIRDISKTRESRILEADRLASELPIAEGEDEWDQILNNNFGLDFPDPLEPTWEHEVKRAFDKNHKLQVDAIQKRADVAAKMFAIVEQEKALAKEEKLRIRDEKHKATKARRLARRGLSESEIQEKLYPKTGMAVTRDAPTKTEEVPLAGHVEAPHRSGVQERRKRGDKYKTSEELKQIHEASLRLKTQEDIAKIKEARTRRKEEEAERRARKVKRKQENAALWEQRSHEKAEGSIREGQCAENQEDSDKKALSAEPPTPQVVRRIGYGSIQRQLETSPSLEELQAANALISEARWRVVKTTAQNLDIKRPSLFENRTKNTQ